MEKNRILFENVKMETQTVFSITGNINIYPCSFELGKIITLEGGMVSQKGRMVTERNGTSRFIPYHISGMSRYTPLYSTPSTIVKMSQSHIIIETRIPRKLCVDKMRKQQLTESSLVKNYLKSHAFVQAVNPSKR